MAVHVLPKFGLPYASANADGSVTCPACDLRISGCDESQRTTEDALTKGAAARYAEHFVAEAEAGR